MGWYDLLRKKTLYQGGEIRFRRLSRDYRGTVKRIWRRDRTVYIKLANSLIHRCGTNWNRCKIVILEAPGIRMNTVFKDDGRCTFTIENEQANLYPLGYANFSRKPEKRPKIQTGKEPP